MEPLRRQGIEKNLQRLRALAPDCEAFEDEEAYQEALAGFRHRLGPSIQYGESLLRGPVPNATKDRLPLEDEELTKALDEVGLTGSPPNSKW